MSRTGTLVGYGLIAAAIIVCQVASLVTHRVPGIGDAVSFLAGRRAARWLILTGWLWVGLHLFTRSHAGG